MEDFMNMPEIIEASNINIIETYKRSQDVKYVARVFKISVKEVNDILKQAGIVRARKKKVASPLEEYGMTEKDFYHDVEN